MSDGHSNIHYSNNNDSDNDSNSDCTLRLLLSTGFHSHLFENIRLSCRSDSGCCGVCASCATSRVSQTRDGIIHPCRVGGTNRLGTVDGYQLGGC